MEKNIRIKIVLATIIFSIIFIISLFIFINSKNQIEIKPFYLYNTTGSLSYDPLLNDYVRGSNSSVEGFIAYGPYIYLPKGDYNVSFFLKSRAMNETDRICYIDVYSLNGHPNGTIISKDLYYSNFINKNGYNEFNIQFHSNGQKDIEFRIYKYKSASEIELSKIIVYPKGKNLSVIDNENIIILAGMVIGITLVIYLASFVMKKYDKYLKNIIDEASPPKLVFLIFLIYMMIIFLSSINFIPKLNITGDEPHYLIVTQSIINDHDIFVKNNYDNGDYRSYYPGNLCGVDFDGQTVLARNGQYISIHGIGLPIIISLPFIIGNVLGVKIFLAAIGSLSCGLIYLLLIKTGFDKKKGAIVTLIVSVCSPTLFYSMSIYTEIIGLFIILFLINVLLDMFFGKPVGTIHFVIAGMLAGFLPFLGIKYIVLTFTLFIILAYFLIMRKVSLKKILGIAVPALVILSIFLYFQYILFGSLDPTMTYTGVNMEGDTERHDIFINLARVFSSNVYYFIWSFVGRFFDQQMGLIFYSPIYLLFFIGIPVSIFKNNWNKPGILLVLAFTIPFYLMYTATGSWGGYCPPSRIFVPIIGAIVILTAMGIEYTSEKKYRFTTYFLIALSISIAIFMLLNPNTLYNNLYSRVDYYQNYASLFVVINPYGISLQSFFPSFLHGEGFLPYLLSFYWLLFFVFMLLMNDLISTFLRHMQKT